MSSSVTAQHQQALIRGFISSLPAPTKPTTDTAMTFAIPKPPIKPEPPLDVQETDVILFCSPFSYEDAVLAHIVTDNINVVFCTPMEEVVEPAEFGCESIKEPLQYYWLVENNDYLHTLMNDSSDGCVETLCMASCGRIGLEELNHACKDLDAVVNTDGQPGFIMLTVDVEKDHKVFQEEQRAYNKALKAYEKEYKSYLAQLEKLRTAFNHEIDEQILKSSEPLPRSTEDAEGDWTV